MVGNSMNAKPPEDSCDGVFAGYRELSTDKLGPLLDTISKRNGIPLCDFRTDILRKAVSDRMSALGTPDFTDYEKRALEDEDELDHLSKRFLISASHFFRDPFTFEFLAKLVVSALVHHKPASPIRVWSAGCARGEEAYSMAILFAEARKTLPGAPEVFVLGTDVDQPALARARLRVFPRESLLEVKLGLLDEYFTPSGDGYAIREDIGARVSFSPHDILSGTVPRVGLFTDYQLILCRNVLIYFEEKARNKAIALFERSLAPGGWLVLGNSETLPEGHGPVFDEAAWGANIFRKRDLR
jgi:chemotaxis methyl-accepting protein methylase